MIDQDKSKQQLIEELVEMRRRVAALESIDAERKRAEEALRESEERFKLFMDNSPAIAWMKDEQGRYVYVNESGARRVGVRPEDRIGKTDFELWPAATAELFRKNDQGVLSSGQVVEVVEESTTPDGKRSYCRNFKFPFQDSTGRRFVGGVGVDISEHKQAAEALKKAHDELEQRVKERTAELAKANEDLQRQQRMLKHLLQSSDHERRLMAYEIHDGLAQQLVGAIMQFQAFDHLKDENPKEASKAYAAGVAMLQRGNHEVRRLVAGLRSPILDESGVVEAVALLVHEAGREKGPKIQYRNRVDFDRLDPTMENVIYRIAQEALTNARKYSKSERISVSLVQHGDRLRIAIRDWGVGFDAKVVPQNHFGLEGIRQRARLLGGKCSIRSVTGKGTRVTVELPVAPRDEAE